MFAQLVSKQAEYAILYGNLLGNTVLPSCIAHSPYSTRFIVYMYVKSGFPLYCRFVLPCYNVARAKFKPYYRMRRKPYEYAYLAKYAVFVCIIPYGVFRIIRRSHIPTVSIMHASPGSQAACPACAAGLSIVVVLVLLIGQIVRLQDRLSC